METKKQKEFSELVKTMEKIYVEATPDIINQILEIAKNGLGHNVNEVNVRPELIPDTNEACGCGGSVSLSCDDCGANYGEEY